MNRRLWLKSLPSLAAAACGPPWLSASGTLDVDSLARAPEEADLHSQMVWQRGALRWQHHRRSRDKPLGERVERDVEFGPEVLHDMRSISKTVIGLLVGQAVGRAELRTDQAVLDFFPELSARAAAGATASPWRTCST